MNGLGTTLLWSAVQVTIVLTAGVLAHRRSTSRRGPVAGAFVATLTLALVIASTVAAFAPHPRWWSWRSFVCGSSSTAAGPAGGAAVPPISSETGPAASSRPGARLSLEMLRAFARWLEPAGTPDLARRHRPWPAAVVVVCLSGTALGLLRLLLGVWAVRDCRGRSRPIGDPRLVELADSLRKELGCLRPVELREAPDVGCAATVGWRRPLILLPRDWTSWNEVEARAVLGHELAHVAGGHYLAGLVARLALALHFYHPLAHWLAGRLRLEHELTADAIGARLAGGRGVYLRVLSRMALEQELRPAHWPARTFLPDRGTLIRRIEMLKDRDRSACPPSTRSLVRAATAAPLVVIAVCVTALNGPDRRARAEPPRDEEVIQAKGSAAGGRVIPRETFDLAYIPDDAVGLAIARPAAALRLPGMGPNVERLKACISRLFPESRLPLEGIEQVSTGLYVRDVTPPPGANYTKSLVMSGLMVRSVEEFDWKAELERLLRRLNKDGKLVEQQHAGSVYYRMTGVPDVGIGECIYVPDARTLVCYPEAVIRKMIESKGAARPACADNRDWKQVERGVFAVVLDNRRGQFTPTRKEEGPEDAAARKLLENSDRWTFGVVVDGEQLSVRAVASSESKQGGASIAQALETVRRLAVEALDGRSKDSPKEGARADAIRLAKRLWTRIRVDETPGSVEVRSEADTELGDLVAAVLHAYGF